MPKYMPVLTWPRSLASDQVFSHSSERQVSILPNVGAPRVLARTGEQVHSHECHSNSQTSEAVYPPDGLEVVPVQRSVAGLAEQIKFLAVVGICLGRGRLLLGGVCHVVCRFIAGGWAVLTCEHEALELGFVLEGAKASLISDPAVIAEEDDAVVVSEQIH